MEGVRWEGGVKRGWLRNVGVDERSAEWLRQTPGHRPVTSYSTRVIAMPVLQAVPHLSSIETESTVHLLI